MYHSHVGAYNAAIGFICLFLWLCSFPICRAQPTFAPTFTKTTFLYTGNYQNYTVPSSGVSSIFVEAYGAEGGAGFNDFYAPGGFGGYITSVVKVAPSQLLYIYVGGKGGDQSTNLCIYFLGGYNGGGPPCGSRFCSGVAYSEGGAPGGGASDIRTAVSDLASRLVVAGGGGGGNSYGRNDRNGGDGGGLIGGGVSPSGGTQLNGGITNIASSNPSELCNGAFGLGGGYGATCTSCSKYYSGAGGGGGYYGGAMRNTFGDNYGGGGGGSSYSSGVIITNAQGVRSGNGLVYLTPYAPCSVGSFLNFTKSIGYCVICPAGSTTLTSGAISISECISTPTSLPTSTPTCSLGWDPDGGSTTHCSPCPAGWFALQNGPCQKCPIGSFSTTGSSECLDCKHPYTNDRESSTGCSMYILSSGDPLVVSKASYGCIAIVLLLLLTAVWLLMRDIKKSAVVFILMLFPTLDILSDVLYLATNIFYNDGIFCISLIVLIIASAGFLKRLYDMQAWPQKFIVPFPIFHITPNVFWFTIEHSTLLINDRPALPFPNYDSIFILAIVVLVFLILAISQFISITLYSIWIIMHVLVVHPLMLLVASLLFQTKLLSLSLVWNYWFFLWTGTMKHKKDMTFDKQLFNEALFFEFVTETLPQLAIQTMNNVLIGKFTPIALFSAFLSSVIAIDGVYQFLYYKLYLKVEYSDVPLMFNFNVNSDSTDRISRNTLSSNIMMKDMSSVTNSSSVSIKLQSLSSIDLAESKVNPHLDSVSFVDDEEYQLFLVLVWLQFSANIPSKDASIALERLKRDKITSMLKLFESYHSGILANLHINRTYLNSIVTAIEESLEEDRAAAVSLDVPVTGEEEEDKELPQQQQQQKKKDGAITKKQYDLEFALSKITSTFSSSSNSIAATSNLVLPRSIDRIVREGSILSFYNAGLKSSCYYCISAPKIYHEKKSSTAANITKEGAINTGPLSPLHREAAEDNLKKKNATSESQAVEMVVSLTNHTNSPVNNPIMQQQQQQHSGALESQVKEDARISLSSNDNIIFNPPESSLEEENHIRMREQVLISNTDISSSSATSSDESALSSYISDIKITLGYSSSNNSDMSHIDVIYKAASELNIANECDKLSGNLNKAKFIKDILNNSASYSSDPRVTESIEGLLSKIKKRYGYSRNMLLNEVIYRAALELKVVDECEQRVGSYNKAKFICSTLEKLVVGSNVRSIAQVFCNNVKGVEGGGRKELSSKGFRNKPPPPPLRVQSPSKYVDTHSDASDGSTQQDQLIFPQVQSTADFVEIKIDKEVEEEGGGASSQSVKNNDESSFVHSASSAAKQDGDSLPLPDGWESKFDPNSGHIYYFNKLKMVTQWEIPSKDYNASTLEAVELVRNDTSHVETAAKQDNDSRSLPKGWEARLDPNSGHTYYFNHEKMHTQWEFPIDDGNVNFKESLQIARNDAASVETAVRARSGDPHPLPKGWKMKVDPNSGLPNYFNKATRQTQWEYPSNDDNITSSLANNFENDT